MAFDCLNAAWSIEISPQGAGLLLSPALAGCVAKVDVFQSLQGKGEEASLPKTRAGNS